MSAILSAGLRWLAWNAATLIVILAILVGAAWLRGEFKRIDDLQLEREQVTRQLAETRRGIDERARRAASRARDLEAKRAELEKLRSEHPLARHIPLTEAWGSVRILEREIEFHQKLVAGEVEARKQLAKGVDPLARRLEAIQADIDKTFVGRAAAVIRQELPLALAVFAAVLLAPTAIKLFLYYVVAPLAASRPPIRLLPGAGAMRESAEGAGRRSGVSVPVVLKEHEELLIKPDYLQSTALKAEKSTRWLLNAAIPFSSLVSGMVMLTRVGAAGEAPVVVSATGDAHSEVGILELSEGAAFVCQPRCLAGVIQDSRRPIRISRHWRLGTLQSWLTLQLRFLVFHGPGKLILKGGRGIRVEAPGAGRLINQAATLGFSANLAYATTRCETFLSYWRGKEELFNDLFTGEGGVYAYEEVPDPQRTGGGAGGALKGFADTILKLFGV